MGSSGRLLHACGRLLDALGSLLEVPWAVPGDAENFMIEFHDRIGIFLFCRVRPLRSAPYPIFANGYLRVLASLYLNLDRRPGLLRLPLGLSELAIPLLGGLRRRGAAFGGIRRHSAAFCGLALDRISRNSDKICQISSQVAKFWQNLAKFVPNSPKSGAF